MTKDELYTFLTSLTGGVEIDIVLFETFLDVAQMRLEGLRPWVALRREDLTQTANVGDNLAAKDLPADFSRWYDDEASVELLNSDLTSFPLVQVPFSTRYKYKTSGGRFCVDYKNNKLYVLGSINQPYTIKQNYIGLSPLVSANNVWIFPERFHKILALMVSIYWRKGIDYDVFNTTMADNQDIQVQAIYDVMVRWDAELQQSMQRGKTFFEDNTIGQGSTSGGFITF